MERIHNAKRICLLLTLSENKTVMSSKMAAHLEALLSLSFENLIWTGNTGLYILTTIDMYWYRYSISMEKIQINKSATEKIMAAAEQNNVSPLVAAYAASFIPPTVSRPTHSHDNVLAEYVSKSVYSFGLQTGRLQKCECGNTLVVKPTWASGKKIKVKSN